MGIRRDRGSSAVSYSTWGKRMKISGACKAAGAVLALLGLALLSGGPGFAASECNPAGDSGLIEIGKIGPKASKLEISTNMTGSNGIKAGEPITLRVKSAEKVYLTVVYVSSTGDAYVLFPNRESAANMLDPGKEYTIFSDKSAVKLTLGDKLKTAKIAFYASSKPVDLAPLKLESGKACIVVPHSAKEELGILLKKIEAMAQDEAFNRVVVALATGSGIRLMGLPSGAASSAPEGVAGVAGRSVTPFGQGGPAGIGNQSE